MTRLLTVLVGTIHNYINNKITSYRKKKRTFTRRKTFVSHLSSENSASFHRPTKKAACVAGATKAFRSSYRRGHWFVEEVFLVYSDNPQSILPIGVSCEPNPCCGWHCACWGRGGAGAEIDAELSDLLAQASDTELDSFYLSEILDEKFVREQRQYLIRWEVSVTSKHKTTSSQHDVRQKCVADRDIFSL